MNSLKIGNLTARVPIIQGGMGVGISLNGLASAVANEGGIGVISCAGLGLIYRNTAKDYMEACICGLKEEIRKAKEKTSGIVGVNIMMALTNFADMVKTSIAEKADIIFAGAGLPLDLPKYRTPDCTTKLVPIVSSARAAKLICDKWKSLYDYLPDMIVVEGPKAGGHLGFKSDQIHDPNFSLETLIPEVVKEVAVFEEKYGVEIPVIAAGGIYTGEDMYNIMQKGAKGVQIASRFVTTHECDADEKFKMSYVKADVNDVEIIQSPVGMPGRALKNNFLEKVKQGLTKPKSCPYQCLRTCDYQKSPYCIIVALYNAYKGNLDNGYAFAGSNAYLAPKISSVKETINDLMSRFEKAKTETLAKIKK
ncbi:NAD(P)H-dependent flavin oxidoreductase [Parabacteroides sp. FAFU027]|uniref:NAD(P)H-dependent flavin oxidoreductase n=1 Tax=Parabacteroides sp. FAFU027 TaxID=2922715 RepID=UPI001FB01DC5|nr:nitronate monooxygenase family protein [Parabacteroides sp. FAFU027]